MRIAFAMRWSSKLAKYPKKIKDKGFSLIEIIAVLAIMAILAAIFIPTIASQIDRAKLAKAEGDCQAIANAIQQFNQNVGNWPRWIDGTNEGTMGLDSSRYIVLHSEDGDKAEIAVALAGDSAPEANEDDDWNEDANDDTDDATTKSTAVDGDGDSLEDQLNRNEPGYRTLVAGASTAWKGPYLLDLKSDPWGNKYYVNVKFLIDQRGQIVSVAGRTGHAASDPGRHAFVLSAGPNEIIETEFGQQVSTEPFKVGGDDIVYEIK